MATLTRKPIVITNIREDDENPGMKGSDSDLDASV